jgi:hypothetical protein
MNLESDENEISSYFFEQYGMFDEQRTPYLINSFNKIGWPDPFPNDGEYGSNDQMLTVREDTALIEALIGDPTTLVYPEHRIVNAPTPT